MTDSQAPEPRCYNCGSLGHWAVACPEPTRETPAGLAAWRNSSGGNQGAAKPPSSCSGFKRSKGPIITKYTPPAPSFNQGMAPYPPPPPSLHPGPSVHFPHYSPPLPPFPAAYPQPPYPYSPHQFSPQAGYGPTQFGQAAHGRLPISLPQSGSFARGRPTTQDYMPPLPPYAPPLVPQPSSSHRLAPAKSPHRRRPSVRPELASNAPPTACKPSSIRISHPLPPKPPPSLDQMKPVREMWNRGHHDRHQHLDQRHISFKSTTSSSRPRQDSHGSPSAGHRYPPRDSPPSMQSDQAALGVGNWEEAPPVVSESAQKHDEQCGENEVRWRSVEQMEAANEVSATDSVDKKVDARNWHQHFEQTSSSLDSAASLEKPAPSHKTDMSGGACDPIGTEANKTPKASDGQEDGEVSSKDYDTPSPTPRARRLAGGKSKWPDDEEAMRRKRECTLEPDVDETSPKRRRSNGSACFGSKVSEDKMTGNLWDSVDIPRQADRKRRGSTASAASRHSGASSQSSDLNSLEAELLGRPTKQRQAEASSPRRQQLERRGQTKAKRRQAHTNSAYSRRCLLGCPYWTSLTTR